MKLMKFGNKKIAIANWTLELMCEASPIQSHIGCNAELELTISDIYRTKRESATGVHMFYSTLCPCCSSEILIPFKDIPQDVPIMDKSAWLKAARADKLRELFEMADTPADHERIFIACTTEIGMSKAFLEESGYTL